MTEDGGHIAVSPPASTMSFPIVCRSPSKIGPGPPCLPLWLLRSLRPIACDRSVGMAPEHIPTALECFGQIDRELSRKYEGAGLGLPLPKHPVELHGATLTIASELVARLLQSCFLLSACSLSAKSPEHSFSCRRKPQKTLNSYELNFYRISERGNSAISPNGGSRRSGYFTGAKMSAFSVPVPAASDRISLRFCPRWMSFCCIWSAPSSLFGLRKTKADKRVKTQSTRNASCRSRIICPGFDPPSSRREPHGQVGRL